MRPFRYIAFHICVVGLAACGAPAESNRSVGELASDRIEIAAEVVEPIIEISVAEGAAVSQGDVLLRQNPERAETRLAETEAALMQAEARLDEFVRGPRSEQISAARANVDGALRDLEFRAVEHQRAIQVHAKQLAAPETLDRAKAAFDAANANLNLRRAQLEELLAGTTVEELRQAEAAVLQAAARRDSASVDLQRHTLTAPADGIADQRLFEIGERPAQGQPVMILLAGEQPHARVYVPERIRVDVRTGLKARVYIDGRASPIPGIVRWVSADAAFTPYFALTERDRSRLSFVAKIDLQADQERLPDGLPVEVEFLFDEPRD